MTRIAKPQTAFLSGWPRSLSRYLPALAISFLIGLSVQLSGTASMIDQQLRVTREALFDIPASGEIHLVEVDAKSLAELSSWPWPRTVHAGIVDQLGKAGADTVAFDIDFSSTSVAQNDAAFASALKRFNGLIVLPTFRQMAGADQATTIDSTPLDALRENAVLASVNVFPDSDGVIRRYNSGNETDGAPRPSMPAMLADATGVIDDDFWVSNSINPRSIPRHSAVDIFNGRFKPEDLRGKTVLIGATAIEMGDRYPTQRFGIQPGVVIQALAAETLLQNLNHTDYGALPLVGMAIMLSLLLVCTNGYRRDAIAALGLGLLFGIPIAAEYLRWGSVGSGAALSILISCYAFLLILDANVRVRTQRLTDQDTALPNIRALDRTIKNSAGKYLFVMALTNYSELMALLGSDGNRQLYTSILKRISPAVTNDDIYITRLGEVAWIASAVDVDQACEHVDSVCALFLSSVQLGDRNVVISPAVGIAQIGLNSESHAIQDASLAANCAKTEQAKWMVYSQAMADASGLSQHILADIDQAIANGDIYFVYQPQYSLSKRAYCGAEALVRWKHRQFGPISPDQFIPLLEKNGRMNELTLHTLAVIQPVIWQWHVEGRKFQLSINVSAPLLADPRFANAFEKQIVELGSARRLLTIEVTESANVQNDHVSVELLQKIRSYGCRVSIDDYGTGNSTLSYLKQFPADEIKIDKSFITDIVTNKSDQTLVRSTIALGHELELEVVAEGIEDVACAELLEKMGCDVGQGWFYAKPMPLEELESLMASFAHQIAA